MTPIQFFSVERNLALGNGIAAPVPVLNYSKFIKEEYDDERDR